MLIMLISRQAQALLTVGVAAVLPCCSVQHSLLQQWQENHWNQELLCFCFTASICFDVSSRLGGASGIQRSQDAGTTMLSPCWAEQLG
jgi:hypothetical protein